MSTRKAVRAAAVLAVLMAVPPLASAQKAVFIVRHAEKVNESEDPLLSAAGRTRAKALARRLGSAGVKAVYVTEFKRTRLTAAPLARALGLTPIVIPAPASQELVDRIRTDNPSDVVLVVGHSNSVPKILALLGDTGPIDIGDEYDNLFVVVPRAGGPPTVLRLKY